MHMLNPGRLVWAADKRVIGPVFVAWMDRYYCLRHRIGQSLKTPDKNGDMFQAPPRRDYVYPFEPGRDRPQRAPRSQSFKTPEKNGDMFQAPSAARQRVPV